MVFNLAVAAHGSEAEPRRKVFVTSSVDGTRQPCYLILPDGFDPKGPPVPLLASLHTWSGDVDQRDPDMEAEADQRGWIYLWPHFRGPNQSPDACGSEKARQDVLDAVDWVIERYPIDTRRIYLTGASGGGHMAMVMAGRHPKRWTAVSAWVGISDLAAWHARHAAGRYGQMIRASCGGAPGASDAVDEQYRLRSPKTWLSRAADVPLDLAAGVHDGHTGSVPVRHTLDAFNVVAAAQGLPGVTEQEIAELSRPDGRLKHPRAGDEMKDPSFGRAIYLRRTAGKARVTVFEGGHERIAAAAAEWLGRHAKP
jgi:poly(3-hydroxybutyrate) depolymerase